MENNKLNIKYNLKKSLFVILLWKIREREIKSIIDVGKEIPVEKLGEFLEKVKEVEEGMKG